MKSSDFFYSIDGMYYKCHRISLYCVGTYTNSHEQTKKKKSNNKSKNNDDKCFKYAVAAALSHQNNENNPQRISKIKPIINDNNWKEMFSITHTHTKKKHCKSVS